MKRTNIDVELWGVSLNVEGVYIPEEEGVMYDADGGGNPGRPAEFEIETVEAGDEDITELLERCFNRKQWDELENLCLEQLIDYEN